jgi:peptide subunit release factor 1 (eRF1)
MNEAQKYELEQTLRELEGYRGRHTEFITVLIPAGFNVFNVIKQIEDEKGTATNIKSNSTRKNVIDALEKVSRQLKTFGQNLPANGLALYAGNVSEVEGKDDLRIWTIIPPKLLKIRMYRCDQTFILDPLKEMIVTDEIYGLIIIERKEASIGILEGKSVRLVENMTSGVPSKVRAGGQCLSPNTLIDTTEGIKKLSEILIGDKIKALNLGSEEIVFTECINKWNAQKNKKRIISVNELGVIESSMDHTFFKKVEDELVEILSEKLILEDKLISYSSNNIITYRIDNIEDHDGDFELVDIETKEGNFFANGILVHNSAQRYHRITEGLAKEFFRRVAEVVKDTFFEMKNLKGILVGGPIPTKEEFLETGQLVTQLKDKVIAVRDIGDTGIAGLRALVRSCEDILEEQEVTKQRKILDDFFSTLGKTPEKVAYGELEVEQRLNEGSVGKLILSKSLSRDKIHNFEELAKQTSVEIHLVSNETAEGVQFDNLGGVGGLLRYAVHN